MTEAETIALMTSLYVAKDPFLHVRFGDGDIFFMTHTGPVLTADGEMWTRKLQRDLLDAWVEIGNSYEGRLLLGDLESYAVSDGCEEEWRTALTLFRWLRPYPFDLVHMEALRVGFGYALPFYQAVRDDTRPRVYVGPKRHEPLADALGCVHVEVPLGTAYMHAHEIAIAVEDLHPEVVLLAAGRGGKIIQGLLARKPELTQVDVGSGLDLLLEDGVRRGTDLGRDFSEVQAMYEAEGIP